LVFLEVDTARVAVRLDAYTRGIIGVATETILVFFMVSRSQGFMKGILTFIFTSIYNIVGLHTALNPFYSLYAYPIAFHSLQNLAAPRAPKKWTISFGNMVNTRSLRERNFVRPWLHFPEYMTLERYFIQHSLILRLSTSTPHETITSPLSSLIFLSCQHDGKRKELALCGGRREFKRAQHTRRSRKIARKWIARTGRGRAPLSQEIGYSLAPNNDPHIYSQLHRCEFIEL